jgi:GNAT superfamily N-acetyltransferase
MELRARISADLQQLELLAESVRAIEGYPPDSDEPFTPGIGAWVAIQEGAIVGHVALNPESAQEVMALAIGETGRSARELAVVARLFVAPGDRRRGVGTALLGRAVSEAHARGLLPVLDVGDELKGANALYAARGWRPVGRVTFPFSDGDSVRTARSLVYIGPSP